MNGKIFFLSCLVLPLGNLLLAQSNCTEPKISPDGKTLVFCSDQVVNNAVFVFNLESGEKRKLVELPTYESSPSWSPDGKQIIFYSMMEDGKSDVYLVDVESSELTNLSKGTFPDAGGPNWLKDGRILISDGGFPSSQIYLMEKPDLSSVKQLTDTLGLNYGPDLFNNELVYCVYSRSIKGIHLKDLDSFKTTQLTTSGERPVFSPDGTKIAFQKRVNGVSQVMIYDRKMKKEIQLTTCSGHCELPNWSGDGKTIYYQNKSSGHFQIWKMDANGKSHKMILNKAF